MPIFSMIALTIMGIISIKLSKSTLVENGEPTDSEEYVKHEKFKRVVTFCTILMWICGVSLLGLISLIKILI